MTGYELLKDFGPVCVALMAGVPPWLKVREEQRKQRADLVQIASDAAAQVIEDLRTEINRHKSEISRLEWETVKCGQRSVEKERRIAELEAEVVRLRADLERHEQQCPTLAVRFGGYRG